MNSPSDFAEGLKEEVEQRKASTSARMKRIRQHTGISQTTFATLSGIPYNRVVSLENNGAMVNSEEYKNIETYHSYVFKTRTKIKGVKRRRILNAKGMTGPAVNAFVDCKLTGEHFQLRDVWKVIHRANPKVNRSTISHHLMDKVKAGVLIRYGNKKQGAYVKGAIQ